MMMPTVHRYMTLTYTVSPGDLTSTAHDLMRDFSFRHLPVSTAASSSISTIAICICHRDAPQYRSVSGHGGRGDDEVRAIGDPETPSTKGSSS